MPILGVAAMLVLSLLQFHAAARSLSAARAGRSAAAPYRTFFVSFSNGSDANSGTSEATPWKLAPGMDGFAGSYAPQVGDHFIFEGGDTWPNSVFPLRPAAGGAPGNPDYYGTDPTWHIGNAFTQPRFDAGGAAINGGNDPGKDMFIDLARLDYITVDDIAFSGWTATSGSLAYGACAVISINATGGGGDQNITINRISVTNFSLDGADSCIAIDAYTAAPWAGNSIVENSVFNGGGNTFGDAIVCVGNVENNTISGMVGMVFPCGHGTISGNRLSDCGYPSFPSGASGLHADAIQVDNAGGAFYIHDNVIHDTGADFVHSNECESMLIGNPGETDYVYNNVMYNINGNAISLTQNSAPGIAAYIWNNSIEGGLGGAAYCVRSGHSATWPTIVVQNNLCVSRVATADPGLSSSALQVDHNVRLTPSQAAADGYSATAQYALSPASARAPTAGAGINLTAVCTPAVTLCADTNYAGSRPPVPRPAVGPWDVGAYAGYSTNAGGTSGGAGGGGTSSGSARRGPVVSEALLAGLAKARPTLTLVVRAGATRIGGLRLQLPSGVYAAIRGHGRQRGVALLDQRRHRLSYTVRTFRGGIVLVLKHGSPELRVSVGPPVLRERSGLARLVRRDRRRRLNLEVVVSSGGGARSRLKISLTPRRGPTSTWRCASGCHG